MVSIRAYNALVGAATMHRKQDRPYNILIVDDGEDFREAFREFLTLFGHQVYEASNGRKALDLLHKPHRIDLVLLDIHMPESNGMEVLAEIKKIAPKLNLIILTGYSAQDIEASIPQRHVQGCIEKTADPDKIRALIEKTLNRSQETRVKIEKKSTSERWIEYCSR